MGGAADIWITAEIGNQDFLRLKISLLTSIIIIEFYRPCSLSFWSSVQCNSFWPQFCHKISGCMYFIRNAQNNNRIWQVRDATADFWQARLPQRLPQHPCAAAVAFTIFNTEPLWFWSRIGSRVKISHYIQPSNLSSALCFT